MNIDASIEIKEKFKTLIHNNRMPQAVIIENGSKEDRQNAAEYLTAFAMCKNLSENRPCGECSNCIKIKNDNHTDVIIPTLSGKTKTISMETLRNSIIPELSIVPNDGNIKIVIFYDADEKLREDAQNALLKSIEEPPQNLLFIFTVESANSLLQTIRSRAQLFTLKANQKIDEEIDSLAQEIIKGIIANNEAELLFLTAKFTSKDIIKDVIPVVASYLSKALSASTGNKSEIYLVNLVSKRLSRQKLLNLLDACDDILTKSNTNINLNLLSTYICATLRRLAWQK